MNATSKTDEKVKTFHFCMDVIKNLLANLRSLVWPLLSGGSHPRDEGGSATLVSIHKQ